MFNGQAPGRDARRAKVAVDAPIEWPAVDVVWNAIGEGAFELVRLSIRPDQRDTRFVRVLVFERREDFVVRRASAAAGALDLFEAELLGKLFWIKRRGKRYIDCRQDAALGHQHFD